MSVVFDEPLVSNSVLTLGPEMQECAFLSSATSFVVSLNQNEAPVSTSIEESAYLACTLSPKEPEEPSVSDLEFEALGEGDFIDCLTDIIIVTRKKQKIADNLTTGG